MTDLLIDRDAIISPCGRHRYLLKRVWSYGSPRVLLVMLNPSTADGETDDATIRSCVRLCRDGGYGGFEVVNLFSWRATDPSDLETSPELVGPDCDRTIEMSLSRCDVSIAAWGAHPMAKDRGRRVIEMIRGAKLEILCFGRTKSGAPRHPLYVKTGTPLEVYR